MLQPKTKKILEVGIIIILILGIVLTLYFLWGSLFARKVNTGPFSVTLPAGWRYYPQQGIDSIVGEFHGNRAKLVFDYGNYSGVTDAAEKEYVIKNETINGKKARIIYPQTIGHGVTEVGFLFDDGPKISLPKIPYIQTAQAIDFGNRAELIIRGHDLNQRQQDEALSIFRSIVF